MIWKYKWKYVTLKVKQDKCVYISKEAVNLYKSIIVWVLFGLMMILVFNLVSAPKTVEEMAFSEFIGLLENSEVVEVTIQMPANLISGELKDGTK
ncbi:MAG TPA: hypothetical protein ENG95_03750, partial [Nitrospirae bacterium]|nr:hypothetical protein [Nitrospirota bacterium]